MATTKEDSRKSLLDYSVYVPLGALNAAFESAKAFSRKAIESTQTRRADLMKGYADLAKRGEKLVKSVSRSSLTQRAVEQTKTARSQVKGAATSVRKAASSTGEATRSAAKKVG